MILFLFFFFNYVLLQSNEVACLRYFVNYCGSQQSIHPNTKTGMQLSRSASPPFSSTQKHGVIHGHHSDEIYLGNHTHLDILQEQYDAKIFVLSSFLTIVYMRVTCLWFHTILENIHFSRIAWKAFRKKLVSYKCNHAQEDTIFLPHFN